MDLFLFVMALAAAGLAYYLYRSNSTNNETTFVSKPDTLNIPPDRDAYTPVAATSVISNPLDVNKDGKVDLKDATEVVKKTRARVKKALDTDGDGKVTVKDVKVTASKAKSKATAAVAVVKPRGRRPSTKKA